MTLVLTLSACVPIPQQAPLDQYNVLAELSHVKSAGHVVTGLDCGVSVSVENDCPDLDSSMS